jgi:hypothetical protein
MSEKYTPKSTSVLASSAWQRLKSITPKDIKKAIAVRVGAIAKFDISPRT